MIGSGNDGPVRALWGAQPATRVNRSQLYLSDANYIQPYRHEASAPVPERTSNISEAYMLIYVREYVYRTAQCDTHLYRE